MAGSKNDSLSFDPEDMTIGEMVQLEKVAGKTMGQIIKTLQSQDFSAKDIQALVWVVKRRENPELTLKEAEGLKLKVLFSSNGNGDSPTPS